jgi:mannose-6-phosphate isomerase-like protein (cupin superfamily)
MSERFDKFTERARRVLQYAQEEAARFNHNYIGTEHMLLGLVREPEGVAAAALMSMGVSLEKVRSAVEFIIGQGEPTVTGDVGLTPRAKKVIEFSVDEARRMNHNYIGTEHLLLGLLREGEGIAAGVLDSLGVGLQGLRQRVMEELAKPQPRERAEPGLGPVPSVRAGSAKEASTDPWAPFTRAGVARASVEALLAALEQVNDEIGYRRYASGPGYECGLVRFMPREGDDERQVTHPNKDVLCQVVQGRGRLRTPAETTELEPGALCRISAGTPHDFVATDEPLVLFYVSIVL